MNSRLELQIALEALLGSTNVYFQPPETIKMAYPAIVYSRLNIDNKFADNSVFKQSREYRVTVIDKNPDSQIVVDMSKFKTAKFERHYAANGLNHDVFKVFY